MSRNKLDNQVRRLCQVLNVLPGLKTYESCCGHSASPFMVFCKFDSKDPRGLALLTRAMDRRYWRYGDRWSLSLHINDIFNPTLGPADAISVEITSQDLGRPAYKQARDLARNIIEHLQHSAYLHAFGLEGLEGLDRLVAKPDPKWEPSPP